ncbi:hypothetical protein ACFL1G_00590 [Planctomycetota bacterium]
MKKSAISKLIAILFCTGCICGCQFGSSDQQLVCNTMAGWKNAVTEKNLDAIMENYSEDFTSERGTGKEQTRDFMESIIYQGYLDDVEIDIDNADINITDDTAEFYPVQIQSQMVQSLSLKFTLKKEDKKTWRIFRSDTERR